MNMRAAGHWLTVIVLSSLFNTLIFGALPWLNEEETEQSPEIFYVDLRAWHPPQPEPPKQEEPVKQKPKKHKPKPKLAPPPVPEIVSAPPSEPPVEPEYSDDGATVVTDESKDTAPTAVEALPVPVPFFKLTEAPYAIRKGKVEYPESMRRLGIEGTVVLSILLDELGRIMDIQIKKSAGKELDAAAIEAIKQTTFAPGKQGSTPVAVRLDYPVVFRLK